jgi:hypothetical protein
VSDEHVTVKVLHGTPRPDFFFRQAKFECELGGSVETLLQTVWHQCNVDGPLALSLEELAEWAIEYRKKRNRSLKVGDAVVVGEMAFMLGGKGWSPVTLTKDQVWCEHGFWARYVPEHLEGVME